MSAVINNDHVRPISSTRPFGALIKELDFRKAQKSIEFDRPDDYKINPGRAPVCCPLLTTHVPLQIT
jgi:hypothetical protein